MVKGYIEAQRAYDDKLPPEYSMKEYVEWDGDTSCYRCDHDDDSSANMLDFCIGCCNSGKPKNFMYNGKTLGELNAESE